MTTELIYCIAGDTLADDFPDVGEALADPDGLLAISGGFDAELLLRAYRQGIFPWNNESSAVLWWSPNPRCVLFPDDLNISRSLRKSLRKSAYTVTFDHAFADVMRACAAPRRDDHDTWITTAVRENYQRLHQLEYAHSVECWVKNKLVGGLYGITMGRVFFGESMFSHLPDTSKICLVHLVRRLRRAGYQVIDCQVYSKHLERLGAKLVARDHFIRLLDKFCDVDVTSPF